MPDWFRDYLWCARCGTRIEWAGITWVARDTTSPQCGEGKHTPDLTRRHELERWLDA